MSQVHENSYNMVHEEEFRTPEGVSIRLQLAPFARRAVAFIVDFIIILAFIFVLFIVAILTMSSGDGFSGAVLILVWFFLLNFYFPLFEGLKGGMTPGKMLTKIRVIDRSGAALTLRGVFTRNFMRDLELWLPLKIIMLSSFFLADLPPWAAPIALLWAFLLILFPLFNGKRLRLGDLVAGTMVVEYPRVALLPDLSAPSKRKPKETENEPAFTPQQLAVYGVYELQVLEDILRRKSRSNAKTLANVAEKIKKKISWEEGRQKVPSRLFLESFYRAQRARLENQMMLGKKKLTKHDD